MANLGCIFHYEYEYFYLFVCWPFINCMAFVVYQWLYENVMFFYGIVAVVLGEHL